MTDLWVDENEYDPKWMERSETGHAPHRRSGKVVQAVDQKRIDVLERIFNDMGYTGKEAHVRARIMYYHQVGYYAMGVQESQRERAPLPLRLLHPHGVIPHLVVVHDPRPHMRLLSGVTHVMKIRSRTSMRFWSTA